MTKTVTVRVAVAVDEHGNWQAQPAGTILGEMPARAVVHHALTATLPIPEVQEVEASVEEGE